MPARKSLLSFLSQGKGANVEGSSRGPTNIEAPGRLAGALCQIHTPPPLGPGHSLGPMDTRATQASPGLEVAVTTAAVDAHECAVLAVSAIAALGLAPRNAGRSVSGNGGKRTQAHKALHQGHQGRWGSGTGPDYGTGCSPVADPACVAARAFASDVVAGVPVATWRAAVAAALAVEASGARLVALGAVPAGLAGHTAALRHRARLLALALTASREGSGGRLGGAPEPPKPRLLWRPALPPPCPPPPAPLPAGARAHLRRQPRP